MRKPPESGPIDAEVRVRLHWLERLIDEKYGGSVARFEEKTGVKSAQVGQWFSGFRALREKAVKRLEEATQVDRGFFDRPIPGNAYAFAPTVAPTAREDVKPYSTQAWPFEDVDVARWERLTERQKGRVEAAMNAELARIESEQKQANSAA